MEKCMILCAGQQYFPHRRDPQRSREDLEGASAVRLHDLLQARSTPADRSRNSPNTGRDSAPNTRIKGTIFGFRFMHKLTTFPRTCNHILEGKGHSLPPPLMAEHTQPLRLAEHCSG